MIDDSLSGNASARPPQSPLKRKALKKSKALRKTLARDPLRRAAWLACREPWVRHWGKGAPVRTDLRGALNKLLKSGWSIQLLAACAYCFTDPRYDHVTRSGWRCAVYWADGGLLGCPVRLQISQRDVDAFNAKQHAVEAGGSNRLVFTDDSVATDSVPA